MGRWADASAGSQRSRHGITRRAGSHRGNSSGHRKSYRWKVLPDADAQARLRHLASRQTGDYIARWRTELETGVPSRLARSVGAHLLDVGYSPRSLAEWLKERRTSSLYELLEDAQGLMAAGHRTWTVFVPVISLPGEVLRSSDHFVDATKADLWLKARSWTLEGLRVNGALICRFTARDPWSAVQEARESLNRLRSRIALALPPNRVLAIGGWARVQGESHRFFLDEVSQRVETPNLRATPEALWMGARRDSAEQVDDAIELASAVTSGSPAAAITGAWAAVEGLLLRPNELGGQRAADRMAAIVTCAFGSAELWNVGSGLDLGVLGLSPGSPRAARAPALEELLRTGIVPAVKHATDAAALVRLTQLIAEPDALRRVHTYLSDSFRRLYNQRNLLMHSGSFNSCALRPTLRTVPELVGAGLDRILHAARGDVIPMDLAARAEFELEIYGASGTRWLHDLLA